MKDPEISRNTLAVPFPYTETHADEWINSREREACSPEKIFAIRRPDGYLIGAIGVARMNTNMPDSMEFGYWLAKPYRRRGIMTRAISAFAVHAFEQLALKHVYAIPFVDNIASQRALEKAGFRRMQMLPRHFLKDGVYLDGIRFERTPDMK
jgi:[ribosomal protein S5]-alanine N-acetyltransferase